MSPLPLSIRTAFSACRKALTTTTANVIAGSPVALDLKTPTFINKKKTNINKDCAHCIRCVKHAKCQDGI